MDVGGLVRRMIQGLFAPTDASGKSRGWEIAAIVGALGFLVYQAGAGIVALARSPYALPALLAVAAAAGAGVWALRRRAQASAAEQQAIEAQVAQGKTYVIMVPLDLKQPKSYGAVEVWGRIAQVLGREHMAFELGGNNEQQLFAVHASAQAMPAVIAQLRAEWPGLQWREAAGPGAADGAEFKDLLAPAPEAPVFLCEVEACIPDNPIGASAEDPLRIVLVGIAGLGSDELGGMQILARLDSKTGARLRGRAAALRSEASAAGTAAGKRAEQSQQAEDFSRRAGRVFVAVKIRLWAAAPEPERAEVLARALASNLAGCFAGGNQVVIARTLAGDAARRMLMARSYGGARLGRGQAWADTELAQVAHLPSEATVASTAQLVTVVGAQLAPSLAARSDGKGAGWIHLGVFVDDAGRRIMVGNHVRDWLTHGFISGTTGSGKSVTTGNTAVQVAMQEDPSDHLPVNLCVIDPHGDLYKDILRALPDDQLDRVVMLDLGGGHVPMIPLLTIGLGRDKVSYARERAMELALEVLRMVEPAAWDGATRMRQILTHALRIVLEAEREGASLVSLARFLTVAEGDFQRAMLHQVDEAEAVRDSVNFWRKTILPVVAAIEEGKSGGQTADSIEAAYRRVYRLVDSDRFRLCLALPRIGPAIDMDELLSGGKILIVPLLADDPVFRQVFGTLFFLLVNNQILGREERAQRHMTMVVIDEFASIAGGKIGEFIKVALAQWRKFGGMVLLTTQSPKQLPGDVRDEVDSNTSIKIALRVSDPANAKLMAGFMAHPGLTEGDLLRTQKYTGYVRMPVKGDMQPACSVRMLPPRPETPPPEPPEGAEFPERPRYAEVFEQVMYLARAIEPRDPDTARPVVEYLLRLRPEEFAQVVREQMAFGRWTAQQLIDQPWLEPDKVRRALKISHALYCLPRFMLQAHYLRTRAQHG